jgi:hypothetical protein
VDVVRRSYSLRKNERSRVELVAAEVDIIDSEMKLNRNSSRAVLLDYRTMT